MGQKGNCLGVERGGAKGGREGEGVGWGWGVRQGVAYCLGQAAAAWEKVAESCCPNWTHGIEEEYRAPFLKRQSR
jgi:hypothetical protein